MIVERSPAMDFFAKAMARMAIRKAFEKQVEGHLREVLEHRPWIAGQEPVIRGMIRDQWGAGFPGLLGLPPPDYTVEVELDDSTGIVRADVAILLPPKPVDFINLKISLAPESES